MGVFGGVFDPPHNGHRDIMLTVDKLLQLDMLNVSVCHTPSHKHQPIASYDDRLIMMDHMIKLHVNPYTKMHVVAGGEYLLSRPNYTVNMLQQIHDQYVNIKSMDIKIVLIMGTDEWNSFPQWHEIETIMELCEGVVVVQRKGHEIVTHDDFDCRVIPYISYDWDNEVYKYHHAANTNGQLSSTGLRERITQGEDVSDDVHMMTWDRITDKGLYGYKSA